MIYDDAQDISLEALPSPPTREELITQIRELNQQYYNVGISIGNVNAVTRVNFE